VHLRGKRRMTLREEGEGLDKDGKGRHSEGGNMQREKIGSKIGSKIGGERSDSSWKEGGAR
jgi:hypothetical protein